MQYQPLKPIEYAQDDRTSQRDILALAVKNRNVESLTFDKAQGGTLTLGGVDNVSGLMQVKDESGNVIVQNDNTGILVNTGKVTIKDTDSSTVIDASGIVSTTQFLAASVQGSGSQSTDSTSYQNVSGVTVDFTLNRTQNVLLFGEFLAYTETTGYPKVKCLVDSTMVGVETYGGWMQTHVQEIISLAAGSHTLKLQFKVGSSGGETVTIVRSSSLVGYVALGK